MEQYRIYRSVLLSGISGYDHAVIGRPFLKELPPPHQHPGPGDLLDAGRPLPAAHTIRQCHGRAISILDDTTTEAGGDPVPADGAITLRGDHLLRIVVADCVPLFLVDRQRRGGALIHAGWRGLASGIVTKAVDILERNGIERRDLVAWAGPSIGPCCYEVGREVIDSFPHGAVTRPGEKGRPMLDLFGTLRRQLSRADLDDQSIDIRPPCTLCHAERLYSHRGGASGRNVALLASPGHHAAQP